MFCLPPLRGNALVMIALLTAYSTSVSCAFCIYIWLDGFCSKTSHLFSYRLKNYRLMQFLTFCFSFCFVGSGINHATEYFISNDEDANERNRDTINPEKLISIIFLGYLCCFSSACFSVITSSFIISPHWEAAYPQLLGWQTRSHYMSK